MTTDPPKKVKPGTVVADPFAEETQKVKAGTVVADPFGDDASFPTAPPSTNIPQGGTVAEPSIGSGMQQGALPQRPPGMPELVRPDMPQASTPERDAALDNIGAPPPQGQQIGGVSLDVEPLQELKLVPKPKPGLRMTLPQYAINPNMKVEEVRKPSMVEDSFVRTQRREDERAKESMAREQATSEWRRQLDPSKEDDQQIRDRIIGEKQITDEQLSLANQYAPIPPDSKGVFSGYFDDPQPRDMGGYTFDQRDDKILLDHVAHLEKRGAARHKTATVIGALEAGRETSIDRFADYYGEALQTQVDALNGRVTRLYQMREQGADPVMLAQEAEDITKGYEFVQARMEDWVKTAPKSEVRKAIQQRQKETNEEYDRIAEDFTPWYATKKGLHAVQLGWNEMLFGTAAGAARMLGDDQNYDWSDDVSDFVDRTKKMNEAALPAEWQQPFSRTVKTLTGKEVTKYNIMPTLLRGAGGMGALMATGNLAAAGGRALGTAMGRGLVGAAGGGANAALSEATMAGVGRASAIAGEFPAYGQNIGFTASMFMPEYDSYVRDAMDKGVPEGLASEAGVYYGLGSAYIERFNPQLFVGGKKAFRTAFAQAIKEGKGPKAALGAGFKQFAVQGGKEGAEELGQGELRLKTNLKVNMLTGADLETASTFREKANEFGTGFILGSIASVPSNGVARKQRTLAEKEALSMAAEYPELAAEIIRRDVPEPQQKEFLTKLEKLNKLYVGNGLTDMPVVKADKIAQLISEKNDLEQKMKAAPPDPVVEAANGNPLKRRVNELTSAILEEMGMTREQAQAAKVAAGAEQLPEGTKAVTNPDGSVTLEKKPEAGGAKAPTATASAPTAKKDKTPSKAVSSVFTEEATGTEEEPSAAPAESSVVDSPVSDEAAIEPTTNEGITTPNEAAAAQAPEDTGDPAGVPAAPEPAAAEPVAKPISRRQKERERKAEQEKVLKDASNVVALDMGASGLAIRYLAGGGKVNTESLIRELGLRDSNGKVKQKEFRGKIWAHNAKSKSIEAVADKIAEENEGIDAAEVRTELINALRDMRGRNYAIDALREYIPQTFEEKEREYMRRQAEDADVNESVDALNGVESEEADAVMAEAEAEWASYTPEQKQAIFDELDAAEAAYTEADAGAVSGETSDTVPRGEAGKGEEGKGDKERQALADQVEETKKARTKFEKDFKKRAQSLFDTGEVQTRKDAQVKKAPEPGLFEAEGDTRATGKDDFAKAVKPYDEAVASAEKALADYDAQGGAREKAAAAQTTIPEAPAQAEAPLDPISKKKQPALRELEALTEAAGFSKFSGGLSVSEWMASLRSKQPEWKGKVRSGETGMQWLDARLKDDAFDRPETKKFLKAAKEFLQNDKKNWDVSLNEMEAWRNEKAEAPLPKKETAAEKRSRELREAERAKKEAKKEATRLADEQDAADARADESAALFKEGTIPVDEILIMHSPNEGADRKVSYRGSVGKDKSMVVIVGSGHQMAVPNEWLRGGEDFAAREAEKRKYEKEVADQLKFEQQNELEQKKTAELTNAKTYQTRNRWEIVRDGVFYHIRDPHTKEVWYKSGSLNRVREVADETTLETPTPAEVSADAQVPVASPAVEAGPVQDFTESSVINRDYRKLKEELGEKKAKKYFEQVDRLFNPNSRNVVEYRKNGVVTMDNGVRTFHALADMGGNKWRVSFIQPIQAPAQAEAPLPKKEKAPYKKTTFRTVTKPTLDEPVSQTTTNIQDDKGTYQPTVIRGQEWVFPGFEEYRFLVGKMPDGGWSVMEQTTGRAIRNGKTKEDALKGAQQTLEKYGKDKLDAAIEGPLQQKPSDKKPVKTGRLRTDRVIAALRAIAPNLRVYAPKTKAEYNRLLEQRGDEGLASAWGMYDPLSNEIFVNPDGPDLKQTLFHEAAHPVLIALAKNKPELFAQFHEELMEHPDAAKYKKHAAQYTDKSDILQAAEALAEFMGDVSAGRVKVSTKPESLWQKFKAWIKDVMAALGWDVRSIDLSDPKDVQQFAAQFAKAVNKGIRINALGEMPSATEVALQISGVKGVKNRADAEQVLSDLDSARIMEDGGTDPKAIKLATGWERGKSGDWIYEIPDANIADPKALVDLMMSPDPDGEVATLGSILDAAELFEMYPKMEGAYMYIYSDESTQSEVASYNPKNNSFNLNTYRFKREFAEADSAEILERTNGLRGVRRVLAHEIAHAVQTEEGLPMGGNVMAWRWISASKKEAEQQLAQLQDSQAREKDDFQREVNKMWIARIEAVLSLPKWVPDAVGRYKALEGEVQARSVEYRADMPDSTKRETLMSATEDVERSMQISLRQNLGLSSSDNTNPVGKAEAAARRAAAALGKAKLKPDQLYALPLPPSVWNGAIRAMQEVIVAGGKAVDAIAAAIKHIQESDWWNKRATQAEKDQVTSHLQGRISDLETSIAAEDVASLKENIQVARAAGAQKARTKQQEARKEFVQAVKDSLEPLRGRLTPAQVTSITARAARVNPASPQSVAKFERVAEKIIAKANYANDLQAARKTAKRIKAKVDSDAAEKKVSAEQALAVRDFLGVDPSEVEDIDRYNDISARVLKTLEQVKVKNGEVLNEAFAITNKDLSTYTTEEKQRQQDIANAELKKEYADLKDAGLVGTMTEEEYIALQDAINDEELSQATQARAEEKLDSMRRFVAWKQQFWNDQGAYDSQHTFSPQEQRAIDTIRSADVSKLDLPSLVKVNTVMNNVMENGDTSDLSRTAAIIEGIRNRENTLKLGLKDMKQNLRSAIENFAGNAERLIGAGAKKAAELRRLSGIDEVLDLGVQSQKRADKFAKDTLSKKKELGIAKEDTRTNRARMFVYNLTQQHYGGTQTERQQVFEEHKAMIEEDIRLLQEKKGLSEQEKHILDSATKAHDELLKGSNSAAEVSAKMKQQFPQQQKLADWIVSRYDADLKKKVFDSARLDNNMNPEEVFNYGPRVWHSLREVPTEKEIGEVVLQERLIGRGVDKRPTGSKFSRTGRPKGAILSYDFIKNMQEGYSESDWDASTAHARNVLAEFFRGDQLAKEIGTDAAQWMRRTVVDMLAEQRGLNDATDKDVREVMRTINRLRKIGRGIALKGVKQWVQQPTVLANTWINLGRDATSTFSFLDMPNGDKLREQFQIAGRKSTNAGYDKLVRRIHGGVAKEDMAHGTEAARHYVSDLGTRILDRGEDLMSAFVSTPDVWSANLSWNAFYKQSLKQQGVDIKGHDFSTEWQNPNKQAASYANQQVERLQGSNSAATMASIYRNGGAKMLLSQIAPFSSFAMNMRMRIIRDTNTLLNGAKEDKYEAAKALGGTMAEQVAFQAVRTAFYIFLTKQLVEAALSALDLGDDDEERKKKDAERTPWRDAGLAALSDFTLGGTTQFVQSGGQQAVNWLYRYLKPTETAADGTLRGTKDLFFQYPERDGEWGFVKYMGEAGVAARTVNNIVNKIGDVADSDLQYTKGGTNFGGLSMSELERQTRAGIDDGPRVTELDESVMTSKEVALATLSILIDMAALTGYSEQNVNSVNNAVWKEVKKSLNERQGKETLLPIVSRPKAGKSAPTPEESKARIDAMNELYK